MKFPKISTEKLFERLAHPEEKINMVLDTDTYNEVDDQFALAYALKSPEKIRLKAVYAAPFYNERSLGPEDGMEKSYEEILKIFDKMNIPSDGMVFKGSVNFLQDLKHPIESEAAKDLVTKAMTSTEKEPLYVTAIGAITNVASAILMEPAIIEKIVVVWLGGNPLYWPGTGGEFNLMQDVLSSRLIFDCGVPLIQIPCAGVTDHLLTTIPELEYYLDGKSDIGSYLTRIVKEYAKDTFAWSKVIWDIAAVAYLINHEWVPTHIVHSPILTDQKTWSVDQSRHFIRSAFHVQRDKIFADVFRKLVL